MKNLAATTILLSSFLLGCQVGLPQTPRPARWARPIQREGVPNLYEVSKDLYRSAQPTEEGMANVKGLGVVTVVNLRSFHSDRDEIGSIDLRYEHIPMKAWHPEVEDVIRFLKIVTDEKRLPVLVHCQHGADRTGAMCAIYRVAVEGWTKEEAIREMKHGGYGFHLIWENLVRWVREMDIDRIREKAGIQNVTGWTSPPPAFRGRRRSSGEGGG